ncbi:MAG: phosphate ABC transporter ATP-binding protein [Pseudomonadota bacterium]
MTFARASRPHPDGPAKLRAETVNFWYAEKHALIDVDLEIHAGETTAFIGPSGCGKSTFLKCLNRMQDDVRGGRMTGRILMDGDDIHSEAVDPPVHRRRFGWVAQKPNPFPCSVHENVAYGPRIHGLSQSAADEAERVERSLRRTGLWEELKDRLDAPGTELSGGQQQRLCIARALSVEPEVLLMDEPCGSLDPISTETIEALIQELTADPASTLAIVLITHNMEQAARVAQQTAFFKLGRMLEKGPTAALFAAPQTDDCADYLAGKFG